MNDKNDFRARNFYAKRVGVEGVTGNELAALAPHRETAHRRLTDASRGRIDAGFGCMGLPREMPPSPTDIRAVIDELRNYHDVVRIDIGGTSLGAKAVSDKFKTNGLRFVDAGKRPAIEFPHHGPA